MLTPTKHRFNVKDYYRMAETGVLPRDARVELLEGEIIDGSPIGPFHGGVVNRLNDLFNQAAGRRWLVTVQSPLRIDDHSEPEPDVMLLKRAPDYYASHHPSPEDVFLLIEVSDTTLELDRNTKLPLYGRAGIAEAWLVNLVEQTIEVYGEPNFTGYGSKRILRAGEKVAPRAFADAVVDVGELLKRQT